MNSNLQLGFISSKDLAGWFGKSYSTYQKRAKDLLNELKYYAEYEKVHGGVEIKKILHTKYVGMNEYGIKMLEYVNEAPNGLVSGSGMGRKFLKENRNITLKEDTVRKKFNSSIKDSFGEIEKDRDPREFNRGGYAGRRRKVWAIRVSKYNEHRFLTKEEEDLFHSLFDKAINSKEVKIAYEKIIELLHQDIDIEEFAETAGEIAVKSFSSVISEFRELTGEQLVFVNECELNEEFDCRPRGF